MQRQLLIVRFELQRGGEFGLGERQFFLGNRQRAGELMIFDVRAAGGVDGLECRVCEIELTEAKCGAGQGDFVRRNGGLQRDDLFAPGNRLAFARQLGRLRHDPAGGDIFWIQLQEMPRDEDRALVILAREEILGLPRKMVFAPDAIAAITAEANCRHENGDHETARPVFVKIPPLQSAHVAEAIVTSGILHCVEELERRRAGTNRARSKPD